VLVLRTLRGLSMAEVARTLGVSRASAEALFEEATEALRARLEGAAADLEADS